MIFGAQPRVAVPQVAQALLPALSASLKKCRNSSPASLPAGVRMRTRGRSPRWDWRRVAASELAGEKAAASLLKEPEERGDFGTVPPRDWRRLALE